MKVVSITCITIWNIRIWENRIYCEVLYESTKYLWKVQFFKNIICHLVET